MPEGDPLGYLENDPERLQWLVDFLRNGPGAMPDWSWLGNQAAAPATPPPVVPPGGAGTGMDSMGLPPSVVSVPTPNPLGPGGGAAGGFDPFAGWPGPQSGASPPRITPAPATPPPPPTMPSPVSSPVAQSSRRATRPTVFRAPVRQPTSADYMRGKTRAEKGPGFQR